MYAAAKRSQVNGTGNGIRNLADGVDITTKVYPSDVIPDKKMAEQVRQRGVFRMNNFLNDKYFINQLGLGASQVPVQPETEKSEQEPEELEVELTPEEFHYAVRMTEVSIKQLTK